VEVTANINSMPDIVSPEQIPDFSISSEKLADLAVTETKIAENAVKIHQLDNDLQYGISAESDNLLTNGSGEVGQVGVVPDGWNPPTDALALVVAEDDAVLGPRSLKAVNDTAAEAYVYQDVPVVGGQVYELSGWIRTRRLLGGALVN
jgi:hypothetical protein